MDVTTLRDNVRPENLVSVFCTCGSILLKPRVTQVQAFGVIEKKSFSTFRLRAPLAVTASPALSSKKYGLMTHPAHITHSCENIGFS